MTRDIVPERSPADGYPYYCVRCACGWAEYLACELPDCKLESPRNARERARDIKAKKLKKATKR